LRGLASGVAAGAAAIAGLLVLRVDAHPLFTGLTHGAGLPALVLSALGGVATIGLVWRRHYEPARYCVALAVAATILGWALAQQPRFLHGLTIAQAAAPRDTQIAIIVAVVAGALILFPSLALLFRLTLARRLTHGAAAVDAVPTPAAAAPRGTGSGRIAAAGLVVGIGCLTVADAAWLHGVGVVGLLVFGAFAYRAFLAEV
jgi:cytochrome d ubiquinol oxidase subunit II